MTAPPLRVAVVGHTNTGKTSLLRTLLRDADFGEVADRPGVTRQVVSALLEVQGSAVVELFDTPGLEDSIRLLERLDALRDDRRQSGVEVIERFLASEEARRDFPQEAAVLRQVLGSDAALYVVDARERVLGRHGDELEILARCARPVVPVLNFVATPGARIESWREHLRRANLHATAEYDTVVFSVAEEERLFEKLRSLLDPGRAGAIDELLAARRRERALLRRGSARLVADLLVDAAACGIVIERDGDVEAAQERFRGILRGRETACFRALLDLHRFRPEDLAATDLRVVDGAWDIDLFSPDAMKDLGLRAGGGAAAGAVAGLVIDAMTGGLSLGAGALTGAAIGGLFGGAQSHGRRLVDRLRGRSVVRADDALLLLLLARQGALLEALARRGHAATAAITPEAREEPEGAAAGSAWTDALREPAVRRAIARARAHPAWCRVAAGEEAPKTDWGDPGRAETVDRLAAAVERALAPPAEA